MKSYSVIIDEMIQAEKEKLSTLQIDNTTLCGEVEAIQNARRWSNARLEALHDVMGHIKNG